MTKLMGAAPPATTTNAEVLVDVSTLSGLSSLNPDTLSDGSVLS